MDLGGGPPLKLQQDIELQDPWVPATPAKTTSTRRPLASTHNFGQPSGQSWLDPLVAPSTGVLNALPPWELAFQNGSNGSLLGNCVPDRALAIAEASARRTTDTCFRLNSPSNRCVNMASICWSPELCGNDLAVRNSASMGEMPLFAPSSAQIAGEQEMNNTSTNKCLLNGKVLPEGSSWSVQKGQYKSPATCLNYLNSFQGTNNFTGISTVPNSVTPLIMEKYSKRTQDEQQALVVSDSVQEVGIEENSLNEKVSLSKQVFDSPADASFSNLMALAHQRAFYKNPESAKQIAALTGELTDKLEGHDIPNERGNEVVELSNSSKQKPKRKKHRPKVVIEGKPSRTPKPATPQAKTPKKAQNQESATGKRKYVRRKVAPSFETSRNGLNNNVELESRKGAKSVRRPLNFDLEEAQISEKYCAFMSIQNQVKENPVQGACGDDDTLNGLRLVKTVDDRGERSPVVENSLTRFDPDVDSSPSQAVNEFLKQLQHQPQAPTLMGKPEVGSLQKHDYSFYLNHAVSKGTKRDNCVIVDSFASSNKNLLHPYNTGDCASQSQNAVREGPHHLDVHKRMRTENVEFGAASNTVLTYTSQTGWTTINASNSCQELNFDGAQKLMAPKKIHTVEHLIFGEDAYGNGYTLLSQGNNLTSNGFMNFNRSPGLLEPSSNITSKASTLSKPSGYSKRKTAGKRGPRGAKKKGENPPVTPVPPNTIDGAAPGERNTGLTTTASTHLLGGNLHLGFVSLGSQDTGNFKVSTNLCFSSGSLAPCMDDMDDIVQKLKWLSINRDHEVTNSQEQNAIVPYAGNSGEMVLYGGNFDQARRRRPRAKVDLDQETTRVWKLLMGKEGEIDQEVHAHKEKWWEEERRIFQGRVDSFIARMHLVQGDRRFSQWKGSVVDSVIGVFLTQNVSDHLSSSAFMALAAKFPLRSTSNSTCSNAEKASSGEPYLASSEAKATENDSKKESSSSNEMVETATGSSGIDNSNGNIKELHEPEVSFGNESPNSCCGMQVSVTRSVSSTEVEDKRFMEEVVSSHNSVTSSQSSTECQAQSSGYIEPNSVLNVEAQNPLIRSMNDGFGSASFTELLQMAEECRFHKLNDQNNEMFLTMQSSSLNCQVTHEIGNNSPVLNQPDNSGSTSQHSLYSLPDKLLDSQLCHSLDHANSTTMDNGSMSREEKNGPLLPSNASETSIYIKHEVPFRECNELAEENLAESSSLTEVLSDTTTARVIDTYVPIRVQNNPKISSETDIGTGISQHSFDNSSLAERADATSNTESSEVCILAEGMPIIHHKEIHSIIEVESPQYAAQYSNQRENSTNQNPTAALSTKIKNKSDVGVAVINNENFNFQKISYEAPKQGEKGKRRKGEVDKITYDWEGLRKEVYSNKFAKERSSDTVDSLDWEAVRCADVSEIAEVIRERGMNNMLAERIKEFLNRLVREHGNIDLEWLRDVPPDKSKDFLLSIRGLGLKSAECVRLLTLHHLAFPVDTNVGRICVRLGWVPLQPLPESLQLHLLELYPVLETIQKYLWPRLCKLDQRTLYELHYQMITFGKVFCTKSKPNCNSCPMRGECRHFASAFASARLALPAPEDKSIMSSTFSSAYANSLVPDFSPQPIAQIECSSFSKDSTGPKQCEPIVEEPATPEPECQETLESAIEEAFFQDPDEIPTISLNFEKFTQNLQHYIQENMELPDGDMSKALVALTPEAASIPMPKLKNVSRLRTEHQVYEIPDSHPLLKGLEQREPDDPCPYLLAIWTPGETAQSTEPPEASCNSQYTGQLCDRSTCFSCNSVRESQGHIVRGTLLIPCRTAMRGSFPLNGTYFQVNEVFADHISSRNPIDVPRDWIWNLPRRTVYFGTSVPTIFRGLSTEAIQQCFWRGFVCVRGFDRATRAPRPLYARLHFPASKASKNRKVAAATAAAKVEE